MCFTRTFLFASPSLLAAMIVPVMHLHVFQLLWSHLCRGVLHGPGRVCRAFQPSSLSILPFSEGCIMVHVLQMRNFGKKFSNLLKVTMVRKWQSQEFWLSSEFLLPHVVSLLKGKFALGLKVRASNCSISGHRTSEFTLSLCKENLGNGGGSTFGIQWINSPLTAVSL